MESFHILCLNNSEEFSSQRKGTYCVWEQGIVWHERNAWVRFLESNRDEKAKLAYLKDVFSGEI